jgi:hypothetical protein
MLRGINNFKSGYQPRTNIVKDEKDDLVADSYSILASWGKYFSKLFNVYVVNGVRHIEKHAAEPIVPEPSTYEIESAIENYKVINHQVLNKFQRNWSLQRG